MRRRIDGIDDRLQDLLIERMEIVARVGAHKRSAGGVAAHQPAREAEIIRAAGVAQSRRVAAGDAGADLARAARGDDPRSRAAFTIAVYAPPEAPGFWDLARDHYGSQTPMLAYRTTGQVIHAVTEGQAAVGVLPMPQEEDPDPWWRHLLSTDDNAPHVIARLPFGGRGNARADGADALAIGRGAEQPTGRDRTLLVAENAPDISRGRMFATLAGARPRLHLHGVVRACRGGQYADRDRRLRAGCRSAPRQLPAQLGPALYRLLRFGGYAVPLSAAELGPAKA